MQHWHDYQPVSWLSASGWLSASSVQLKSMRDKQMAYCLMLGLRSSPCVHQHTTDEALSGKYPHTEEPPGLLTSCLLLE